MPLVEILALAARSPNSYYPVVDEHKHLSGIFSLRDLRSILTGNRSGELILATDIAVQPVLSVNPHHDLHAALRVLTQKNIDEVPVVDPDDPRRVLGMLNRKDVIAAYHERILQLRSPQEDP
jgi:CIC family chloride channel protein